MPDFTRKLFTAANSGLYIPYPCSWDYSSSPQKSSKVCEYRGRRSGKIVREKESRLTHAIPTRVTHRNYIEFACYSLRSTTFRDSTTKFRRGINPGNLSIVQSNSCGSSSLANCVNFALVNAQSVKNKVEDFLDHIIDKNIDLCLVTETWLKDIDTVTFSALSMDGYVFRNFARETVRAGGGTGIMFRGSFNVTFVKGKECNSFEFSEWNIEALSHTVKAINVYRPPYSQAHPVTSTVFFEEFSALLESVVMCSEILLIAGDFNFHMDDFNNYEANKFRELLETFGLAQHVFVPTHTSGHTLDLVITRSSNDLIVKSPSTTPNFSDHYFVECELLIPRPALSVKTVQFRKIKQINIDAFKSDLSSSDLLTRYWLTLDELTQCYYDTLSVLLEKHAPLKTKTIIARSAVPWFNDSLKDLKRKRRSLERKMSRNPMDDRSKTAYRCIRNKYSAHLKQSRRSYYTDLISSCSGDSRKLFNIINNLCSGSPVNSLPSHDDPFALANDFGQFFVKKVELIKEKIGSTSIEPPRIEVTPPGSKLQSFKPLSEEDVCKIIMGSNNSSCLLDPLPTYLLKSCLGTLSNTLTSIVNRSLQEGYVPNAWKSAVVVPLLKKQGLDPILSNYRPVSNLSFISKVVEKAVAKQLLQHCAIHAPLPTLQSSYRKFHSTETALLKVQSDILMSMDKQEVSLLVLLDLSAAFDTIDHGILLDILENDFGITDSALMWVNSFLSGRKQRIIINNCLSNEFNLECGVPQGSCLGPILFLLYSSRLFQIIAQHLPIAHGYADDTQLYYSFKPEAQDNAVQVIEECVDGVRAWMTHNRLMLNDIKTEILIIGSRQQLEKINIESVRIGESLIKPVKSTRNLGAWFDERMSMSVHIGKICSRAFRGLYNIRQIRKFLSVESSKTLVHAFITSHLDYCNSLLAGLPQYQYDRLQKILNAAARMVSLLPKFSHVTPVLMKLHWLPIKYRIQFKILLMVYKALNGLAPKYLTDSVKLKSATRYSLRSSNQALLEVPTTRCKTFGDRSFYFIGPCLWNTLPFSIRMSPTIGVFKQQLKTFLFKKAYAA